MVSSFFRFCLIALFCFSIHLRSSRLNKKDNSKKVTIVTTKGYNIWSDMAKKVKPYGLGDRQWRRRVPWNPIVYLAFLFHTFAEKISLLFMYRYTINQIRPFWPQNADINMHVLWGIANDNICSSGFWALLTSLAISSPTSNKLEFQLQHPITLCHQPSSRGVSARCKTRFLGFLVVNIQKWV